MRTRIAAAAIVVMLACGAWAYAQQPAAKGTLTPADYAEIQQLYARYNHAIDKGDAEAWAGTFTPDGVFNNTNRGHDALVQFVNDWRDKRNGTSRRHWNSNLMITPTAEGASGSVYLILLDIGVRPPVAMTTGIYEDTLLKTPQGWRFKTRVVHADPAPRPTQQQ